MTGEPFGERQVTMCRLLLPALREMLVAVATGVEPDAPALTARQREIVELVATGPTNQEIAHALGISVGTVRAHLDQVYARLGVSSRTAAVAAAATAGPRPGAETVSAGG
ncbi:helix-turn-helix transcriptional regulator [Isoptericola sp. b515]|uniref:response regulator transcription factor n=1 Tax=Isoptericola sp. b515 TaxID=3064652 RepID=UPI002713397D|nr:helix-turn-helix transcriptional regulator [Isoptericola sp. b515]MDO8147785.1 helix-turn-helix transcriptional regulator [Isoptericola sp. b515]